MQRPEAILAKPVRIGEARLCSIIKRERCDDYDAEARDTARSLAGRRDTQSCPVHFYQPRFDQQLVYLQNRVEAIVGALKELSTQYRCPLPDLFAALVDDLPWPRPVSPPSTSRPSAAPLASERCLVLVLKHACL